MTRTVTLLTKQCRDLPCLGRLVVFGGVFALELELGVESLRLERFLELRGLEE
jgi:hypothetical protein